MQYNNTYQWGLCFLSNICLNLEIQLSVQQQCCQASEWRSGSSSDVLTAHIINTSLGIHGLESLIRLRISLKTARKGDIPIPPATKIRFSYLKKRMANNHSVNQYMHVSFSNKTEYFNIKYFQIQINALTSSGTVTRARKVLLQMH